MTPRITYTRFAAFQNKIEGKYTPNVQAVFISQAKAFNEYAKQYGYPMAQGKIFDFFPAAPLIPIINDLHYSAAGNYGNAVYKELRGTKGQITWVHAKGITKRYPLETKVYVQLPKPPNQLFNTTQEIGNRIVASLRMSLLNNVHGMTNTVKDDVLKIIQEGSLNGWGYDKTAVKIADQVGSKWRALRIVRTESIKASNMGAIEGAKLTGFEMTKTWLSAHDNRVRGNPAGKYPDSEYDHWDLSGVTLPLDGKFLSGSRVTGAASSELLFPGDPNGAPGTIINCRCTLMFNVKRDANNRPIRTQQRQRIAA